MKWLLLSIVFLLTSVKSFSQNDLDALRYSQTGVGGNARFVSMGGAFGALGANTSCLNFNPAGIGIYRKGEINISPGIRFTSVGSTYNNSQNNNFTPSFIFSGLGLVGSWKGQISADVKHSVGISHSQLQNFNTNTTVQGYGNKKTIMNDIIDNAGSNSPANLDPSYSGMAFNNYLLDTLNGKYYGFIDPNKNMLQTKSITATGHVDELAFGYTYSFKEKFYLGASLGVPLIKYDYNGVYTESDDKDSLRIYKNASNVTTSTYSYAVWAYPSAPENAAVNNGLKGGFTSMSYTEKFQTNGSGYNLKLGFIYRVNEFLRVGANYQTPTVLNLTDTYVYNMTALWDSKDSYTQSYPPKGGIFKYSIITPMRFGASIGFIYKKLFVIGIDYENVDYGQASISGGDASNFTGVNKTISTKYKNASNLRAGVEININNVMVRLGYVMNGSAFGNAFGGQFVRTSFSLGLGLRSKNWAFDLGLVRQMYNEDYYMYNPKFADKSIISFVGTTVVATIGLKFQ